MDNVIDLSIPVSEVILVELGFKPLANPVMRNTVGRVVSIKKGAGMNGIDLNKIKQTLELNGYEVVGI